MTEKEIQMLKCEGSREKLIETRNRRIWEARTLLENCTRSEVFKDVVEQVIAKIEEACQLDDEIICITAQYRRVEESVSKGKK